MEPVIHVIHTVRHTTCKGKLYTYLHVHTLRHADVQVVSMFLDDADSVSGQGNFDYDPSTERHCCLTLYAFQGKTQLNPRSPASAHPQSRWHLLLMGKKNEQRKRKTKQAMLKMPPATLRAHITMVTSSSTDPISSICLN